MATTSTRVPFNISRALRNLRDDAELLKSDEFPPIGSEDFSSWIDVFGNNLEVWRSRSGAGMSLLWTEEKEVVGKVVEMIQGRDEYAELLAVLAPAIEATGPVDSDMGISEVTPTIGNTTTEMEDGMEKSAGTEEIEQQRADGGELTAATADMVVDEARGNSSATEMQRALESSTAVTDVAAAVLMDSRVPDGTPALDKPSSPVAPPTIVAGPSNNNPGPGGFRPYSIPGASSFDASKVPFVLIPQKRTPRITAGPRPVFQPKPKRKRAASRTPAEVEEDSVRNEPDIVEVSPPAKRRKTVEIKGQTFVLNDSPCEQCLSARGTVHCIERLAKGKVGVCQPCATKKSKCSLTSGEAEDAGVKVERRATAAEKGKGKEKAPTARKRAQPVRGASQVVLQGKTGAPTIYHPTTGEPIAGPSSTPAETKAFFKHPECIIQTAAYTGVESKQRLIWDRDSAEHYMLRIEQQILEHHAEARVHLDQVKDLEVRYQRSRQALARAQEEFDTRFGVDSIVDDDEEARGSEGELGLEGDTEHA